MLTGAGARNPGGGGSDGKAQVVHLTKGNMRWSATLSGRTVRVSWRDGASRVEGEPREYDDENQAQRAWKKAIDEARAKGFVPEGGGAPTPEADRHELVRLLAGVGGLRSDPEGRWTLMLEHGERSQAAFGNALAAVSKSVALRAVERLEVRLQWPFDCDAVTDALAGVELPASVKGLHLCRFDGDRRRSKSEFAASAADFTALGALLSTREEVVLQAGWVTLPPLRLPRARTLAVRVAGLSRAALAQVAAAEAPSLERLELWFGSPKHGAECEPEDLRALLSARFPFLRELALHGMPFADAVVGPLLESPLVAELGSPDEAGLERLDLSCGGLSDAGAEVLLSHADKLEDVDVDLELNEIGRDVAGRLIDAGFGLQSQRLPGAQAGLERYLPFGGLDDGFSEDEEVNVTVKVGEE